MKIAFLYAAYPPIPDGGAGFLHNLAKTLVRCGAEVSVITTAQVASEYRNGADGDIRVYPVMDDRLLSRGNYRRLKNIFRQIQPEVIHIIYISSSVGPDYQSPIRIKFAAPQPLVTTLYGFSFLSGGLGSRLAILTLLHLSDCLLSDNDFVIGALRSYVPYLRKKLYYMPSGANISIEPRQKYTQAYLRAQYSLDPDALYICHFGYLDQTRNIESIFQAIKK